MSEPVFLRTPIAWLQNPVCSSIDTRRAEFIALDPCKVMQQQITMKPSTQFEQLQVEGDWSSLGSTTISGPAGLPLAMS